MKIQLPLTILTHIGGAVAATISQIESIEKVHKGLKKIQERRDIRMASLMDIPVEEVIKQREEKQNIKNQKLLDKFFNFSGFKNKKVTVTKTETDLEIHINEEFIIDLINIHFKLYQKVLPVSADAYVAVDEWIKEGETIEAKWEEDSKEKPVETEGWTFVKLSEDTQSFSLKNGKMINLHDWKATKGKFSFKVFDFHIKDVINGEAHLLYTKEFPLDLIKALEEHCATVYTD